MYTCSPASSCGRFWAQSPALCDHEPSYLAPGIMQNPVRDAHRNPVAEYTQHAPTAAGAQAAWSYTYLPGIAVLWSVLFVAVLVCPQSAKVMAAALTGVACCPVLPFKRRRDGMCAAEESHFQPPTMWGWATPNNRQRL